MADQLLGMLRAARVTWHRTLWGPTQCGPCWPLAAPIPTPPHPAPHLQAVLGDVDAAQAAVGRQLLVLVELERGTGDAPEEHGARHDVLGHAVARGILQLKVLPPSGSDKQARGEGKRGSLRQAVRLQARKGERPDRSAGAREAVFAVINFLLQRLTRPWRRTWRPEPPPGRG